LLKEQETVEIIFFKDQREPNMMEFEKLTLRQKIVRFLGGLLYGVGLGFLQGLELNLIAGYEFFSLNSYYTFAQAIAITVAITVACNLVEPEIILFLWFGIWLSYVLPFFSWVAPLVISWLLFWLSFGLLLVGNVVVVAWIALVMAVDWNFFWK